MEERSILMDERVSSSEVYLQSGVCPKLFAKKVRVNNRSKLFFMGIVEVNFKLTNEVKIFIGKQFITQLKIRCTAKRKVIFKKKLNNLT
jgi:hypothetical protein